MALAAADPPAIRSNGVVNAAGEVPSSLPGGAIARGARIAIHGVRLEGGAVSVHAAGVERAARILSSSGDRIEAVMPAAVPAGPATVVVRTAAGASAPFAIRAVHAAPGLYSINGKGWGPARATPAVSAAKPARPGQTIAIDATGVGASTEVFVGSRPARVLTPAASGIRFEIPSAAPEGCHVPVQARTPGGPLSNTVTIPIRRAPGACEPAPYFPMSSWSGRRAALVVLARTEFHDVDTHGDFTLDEMLALFLRVTGDPPDPLLMTPPAFACATYATTGVDDISLRPSFIGALLNSLRGEALDPGYRVDLSRGGSIRRAPRIGVAPGVHRITLGGTDGRAASRRLPLFFEPGAYVAGAAGGYEVGAFQVGLESPARFEWTNRAALATIDRGRDTTIEWRGATAGNAISIFGVAIDRANSAAACWMCMGEASAGRFTVPGAVLATLPAAASDSLLFLTSLPRAVVEIRAPGLEEGAGMSAYVHVAGVRYR